MYQFYGILFERLQVGGKVLFVTNEWFSQCENMISVWMITLLCMLSCMHCFSIVSVTINTPSFASVWSLFLPLHRVNSVCYFM